MTQQEELVLSWYHQEPAAGSEGCEEQEVDWD